jgi:hypothetical protein
MSLGHLGAIAARPRRREDTDIGTVAHRGHSRGSEPLTKGGENATHHFGNGTCSAGTLCLRTNKFRKHGRHVRSRNNGRHEQSRSFHNVVRWSHDRAARPGELWNPR